MKIMVVGGGGREHAIIKKLKENPDAVEIYALPGNAGISADAVCVPIGAKDVDGIVDFAVKTGIEYAVVAPDDPLVLGAVDRLESAGIPCFGPNAAAAEIEGSKIFAKELMKKYGIPTARYRTFDDTDEALRYIETVSYPTVIKADGLALGKGVVIAADREEAVGAIHSLMEEKIFGNSGCRVVIEEYLTGPEVSVLAFTDGKTVKPMVSSMDHKRAFDGDLGPNTGGMGTIAPNPFYTPEIAERCRKEIFEPTVRAMSAEGRPFRGCLYFGLMLTPDGPKGIEYNCRFGAPETQVVLPLLESDLLTVMQAVTKERLAETEVRFSDRSACCVIVASEGYPKHYETGFPLSFPPDEKDGYSFVAGAKKDAQGNLISGGGRVVGETAVRDTLKDAVRAAYERAENVVLSNGFYRHDIGRRALAAEKVGGQ